MATSISGAFEQAVERVTTGADSAQEASRLYALLSDDERRGLLDGDLPFWQGMGQMLQIGYNAVPYSMGRVDRIGLPGVQFADGPRGVVCGHSTAFPVPTGRAATFDAGLEERIGAAIGLEARAQGANFFGGVCVNLPRHPAWGRSQESYGEEPALLGEMGAALARGTRPHVMPCVKHFAVNSMENARFSVDVTVSDADLHEYYLPHFKRIVQSGADSVMSAYNSVNGQWAGENAPLLTGVLREQWGFEGFVMSDFIWGARSAGRSLAAGQDLEAPFTQQRGRDLEQDIAEEEASWEDVERSAVRIISRQLELFARRTGAEPGWDVIACHDHRALAREAARRAVTLVRNESVDGAPVLPLAGDARVAVVGRLADLPNTGDNGSSDVRAPHVVTAAEGLRAALPGAVVDASGDADAAATLATDADAAVVVVGYTAADEGEFVGGDIFTRPELVALYPEPVTDADRGVAAAMSSGDNHTMVGEGGGAAGGDRSSIRLKPEDVELIRAVAAVNPRTVVAIVAGGTVIVDEWIDSVAGALFAWYPGMEGGHALADVLTGEVDATGRLPFAVPFADAQLPEFDVDATAIIYDGSFGQRRYEGNGGVRFPFGFGLSYAPCAVVSAAAERSGDLATVSATVRNAGPRDTHHVVQVYARRDDGLPFLVGFGAVPVPAAGERTAEIAVRLEYAGRWDAAVGAVVAPQGPVSLDVARYWGDPEALTVEV